MDANNANDAEDRIPPPDFDLTGMVRKLLADHQLTAEDALTAILEGLMDDHKAAIERNGPSAITYLQGLEVVICQQHNRNMETCKRQARDDEPDDCAYISGLRFGQLAGTQRVVSEMLCRCMKVFGAKPIRKAA